MSHCLAFTMKISCYDYTSGYTSASSPPTHKRNIKATRTTRQKLQKQPEKSSGNLHISQTILPSNNVDRQGILGIIPKTGGLGEWPHRISASDQLVAANCTNNGDA